MRARAPLDADLLQQRDGSLARLGRRHTLVGADRLHDLIADPIERVEAGQRVLEHHADARPAYLAHLVRRGIVDALRTEPHLAAGDAPRWLQQADDGCPVSDLPAPNSPTTPSTSPAAMSNETPSTATSLPRRPRNATSRLRTERTGSVMATWLVSRFRNAPNLTAIVPSEPRNHQGHYNHQFNSAVQIEKFAPTLAANSGEFLDHHTSVVSRRCHHPSRQAPSWHLQTEPH